ncbi:GNAT family N-acetyltransferase [Aureisphaera sp. CAU 1614]|uniref:GNAT family N-acetyltransferase n=1 Tax=Halomarinibacterium sedimenti TaxID=2857106 RepID=A0A9X1JVY6_9FLAO|nr:GNAT family N-acetyltransferase [Halomarinibacterium sedimenti]MBW2938494.1 GNAT family N-acetyltransferase [Halomarinibacterium sedimenti]
MIVRPSRKEDMPQVLELIKELAVFEKEPDAVQVSVAELEAAGFSDNPQFTCFVAEKNLEIIGMALVYFRFSTWVGKTVHLEDLIVKEKMRGKGVGMALYKRVMEYAKEESVKRVNWMVLGWNKDAIDFYEGTGATVMEEWWQVEMDQKALQNFLNI